MSFGSNRLAAFCDCKAVGKALTGETGKNVIALLEEKEYAKEGEVRIFDISVVKDGSKVQPSGKVKVTVPAPFESESGYVTPYQGRQLRRRVENDLR